MKNTLLGSINIELKRFTLFKDKTITIAIANAVKQAKDINATIKNVFKTLFSLALYPMTIEKKIIEINIKNSTITNKINNSNVNPTEILPDTTIVINNPKFSNIFGDAKVINNETIIHTNPKVISIIAVKNFEVIN